MLGITRFILAILVLLSHTTGASFPFNPGVVAVIVFYFTSGYLMRRSYQRFLQHSARPVRTFYLDRVLKLFPQYAVVVLASFAFIGWLGPAEHVLFLNQEPSLQKIVLNLALLPANYVFPPLMVDGMLPHPIIPPAWSLASEFHFYLLLPAIFLLRRKAFLAVLCLSMLIQLSSLFFGSGDFNSDNFGYRYIFGVLTFFLFGYAFAQAHETFYRRIARSIWAVYAMMLLVIAPAFTLFAHRFALEVLLGAVLAWPLVSASRATIPGEPWLKALDNLAGRLAYPIFISHFLAFYLCEKLLGFSGQAGLQIPVAIAVCLALSGLLMQFQALVDAYRLGRRGFASLSGIPEVPSGAGTAAES